MDLQEDPIQVLEMENLVVQEEVLLTEHHHQLVVEQETHLQLVQLKALMVEQVVEVQIKVVELVVELQQQVQTEHLQQVEMVEQVQQVQLTILPQQEVVEVVVDLGIPAELLDQQVLVVEALVQMDHPVEQVLLIQVVVVVDQVENPHLVQKLVEQAVQESL